MNTVDLLGRLRDVPSSFHFFQAVRILELLAEDRATVGLFEDPKKEVSRFRAHQSLDFPPSDIDSIELDDNAQWRMTVNFMGLIGPSGVMPHHYTVEAINDSLRRNGALGDFLSIFEHRIISLLYRAWKRNKFYIGYPSEKPHRFTSHLLDLVGLGLPSMQGRMAIADEAMAFYGGFVVPQARSAVALEMLLAGYFAVPVMVEQFVGGWYRLPEGDQCRLGEEETPSSQLGRGAVAGDEIWDQQARVRVRLGPVSRHVYEEFLPGGVRHKALRALTRFFSYDQFDFEVQLVLAREAVPPCVLGQDDGSEPTLGWCSWIRSKPFTGNADETTFTLESEGLS